jgi:signal transduction histidine kinase
MPDMDGIELLQRIKEESPDTEVIMFTGHGDMDLAIQSLKNDATDFVTKPVNMEVLEIAIQRAMERLTLKRRIREYTENLEELVEEKTRKLLEAERMAAIGETVSELSHTIKNIADGLQGSIFVLGEGIEQRDETYLNQGWEMIRGNVDKIRTLSLDLLSYGKYAEVHPVPGDPNVPAKEAAELLAARAEECGVQLEIRMSSELVAIDIDTEAVGRCLVNLVMNAIDACLDEKSERPKCVHVETLPADENGVEYRVTDTGHGMSDDVQNRIFQGFFSTKGTRGTGIGLMMTKKIVDRHGGHLYIDSKEGEGTTVRMFLPPDANNRMPVVPR